MKITTLIEELDRSDAFWAASTNIKAEVHSFQPLTTNSDLRPNIVYIGTQETLPRRAPDDINFICAASGPFKALPELANCNVILTEGDTLSLIKDVSLHFSTEQRLFSDMHQLMQVLDKDNCLSNLVETAYVMLKSPIIVVDSSYKILAMSKARVKDRPDLEMQRQLGYMSDSNIESMKRGEVYEKAREIHYPYYSIEPHYKVGWINALVYVHNIEAAEVGVMESDHEFTRYDYELIHYLCKLVSLELQKSSFYHHNRMLMHSVFLSELLEDRIKDELTAATRARKIGWEIPDVMQLLMIFDLNQGAFDQRAQLICKQVKHMLPASHWVIYKRRLIFLLPLSDEHFERLTPGGKLSNYLDKNHLVASLSERFSNISTLRKHYDQCEVAYDLGMRLKPKRRLHRYSDYLLHHVGLTVSRQSNLYDYYHPGIIAISEYDKAHDSDLLKTLESYLLHIDSPSAVSKELSIHKNTLFYRINKIKEQFGLDLSNGYERAKILMTLSFMKLK